MKLLPSCSQSTCIHKKKQQSAFFQRKKREGDEKCAVLQVDFAENYTSAYQDEIQAAHWHQSQITVFTAVAWIKEEAQSYVLVSDNLHHEKKSVTAFLSGVIKNMMSKHSTINVVHIFSDGAASQFKNKYIWAFLSITFNQIFLKVSVKWHYFATSHGKGAVDGVGSTVHSSSKCREVC